MEGDKPGSNLAWRLRQEKSSKSIHEIQVDHGIFTSSSREIKDLFYEYFGTLYNVLPLISPIVILNYLTRMYVPAVSKLDSQWLDGLIEKGELQLVFANSKKN